MPISWVKFHDQLRFVSRSVCKNRSHNSGNLASVFIFCQLDSNCLHYLLHKCKSVKISIYRTFVYCCITCQTAKWCITHFLFTMRAILLAMFPKIWISALTWTVYSIKTKRAVCKIICTRNLNLTNYTVLKINVHTRLIFFLHITSLFRLYFYVNAGTHEECTIYYKPMHVLFISIQWQSSWHFSLAFLFRNINGNLINDINKEDSKLIKLTENIHYLQK